MKSIFAGLSAAVNAVGVALAGYLLVAVPAILLWMVTFKLDGDLAWPLSGASAAWLLGHAVPLVFSFSASEALSFGAAPEAVHLPLSLPLLGLAVMTAVAGVRFGVRIPKQPLQATVMLTSAAVGFALVSTTIAFAAAHTLNTFVWWAALKPLLFFIVPALLAFLVRNLSDLLDLLPDRVAEFGGGSVLLLPLIGRLAAATACALLVFSALLFALSCVLHFAEFVRISQLLHLDVLGVTVLFLACLLLLPVGLLWTLAWFSGSGFRVGAGSSVSPFEQLLGPVPSFPMFSVVPADWGNWAFLAPLLLFLVVVTVGVMFSALLRRETLLQRAVVIAGATLLLFLVTAFLMGISGGAIGPGRLTVTGPEAWLVAVIIAGISAAGLALGVWIGSSGDAVAERLPGSAGAGVRRFREARRAAAEAKRPQLVAPLTDAEPRSLVSEPFETGASETEQFETEPLATEVFETELLTAEELASEWQASETAAAKRLPAEEVPARELPGDNAGGITDGSFGFLFQKRQGRNKPPKSGA